MFLIKHTLEQCINEQKLASGCLFKILFNCEIVLFAIILLIRVKEKVHKFTSIKDVMFTDFQSECKFF